MPDLRHSDKPHGPVSGRPLVVGIGEFLWDLFPGGAAMGGAPANFTCHAAALGADARLVSRVGNDAEGERLLHSLESHGVNRGAVSIDPVRPTGSVSVEVMADGQPHFTIHPDVAWDHLVADAAGREAFAAADAVCFGTLAQRSAASAGAIRELLDCAGPGTLRIFDVNLRGTFFTTEMLLGSLELADVVKLNDGELAKIVDILGIGGAVKQQLASLAERYQLRLIACTLGAEGSILHDGAAWAEHSGCTVELRDTVGAGDSFLAATTLGLLGGWPLDAISEVANEVAAYVCSCHGATPALPEYLRARFRKDLPLPASA
ncbi:PfkB family carbohydrate kinase [Luteolibacter sp. Populi]|uniref:PfkB family carbohydrate kinase n=1 Tax=Luteolibacter sp. Populi TaxID=3230487 RepID=UPI0034659659